MCDTYLCGIHAVVAGQLDRHAVLCGCSTGASVSTEDVTRCSLSTTTHLPTSRSGVSRGRRPITREAGHCVGRCNNVNLFIADNRVKPIAAHVSPQATYLSMWPPMWSMVKLLSWKVPDAYGETCTTGRRPGHDWDTTRIVTTPRSGRDFLTFQKY